MSAAIEVSTLAENEAVIERGLATFVEVGTALADIRDRRLYLGSYSDFDTYCRERWGLSGRHANRSIEAAEVVNEMGPIGPTPTTESQARELAPLRDEPEKMAEVMDAATAVAEEEGRSVTARDIAEQRDVVHPPPRRRPEPTPEPEPPRKRQTLQEAAEWAVENPEAAERRDALHTINRALDLLGAGERDGSPEFLDAWLRRMRPIEDNLPERLDDAVRILEYLAKGVRQ